MRWEQKKQSSKNVIDIARVYDGAYNIKWTQPPSSPYKEVQDDSGAVSYNWFMKRSAYITKGFRSDNIYIYGKVTATAMIT